MSENEKKEDLKEAELALKLASIKYAAAQEALGLDLKLPQATISKSETVKPEFEYPIVCKAMFSNSNRVLIVKFTDLNTAEVLRDSEGGVKVGKSYYWARHTNTADWTQIPYDHERGLFHHQIVWAWDELYKAGRYLGVYDANEYGVRRIDGANTCIEYKYYEAYPREYAPFMLNMIKACEDKT